MSPVADMTKGVKAPCSICRIRSLYCFFFSFSFTSYDLQSSWLTYRFAVELKTPTSKNGTWHVNQKPRVLTSTLAWFDLFGVFLEYVSPFNGCNCGSTRTSLRSSVNKLTSSLWYFEYGCGVKSQTLLLDTWEHVVNYLYYRMHND